MDKSKVGTNAGDLDKINADLQKKHAAAVEDSKKQTSKRNDDITEKPDVDPGIDYMKWSE